MSARRQDGFTLIELLLVMTISLIMLTAVLTTFDGFQSRAQRNAQLNESHALTRQAIDQLARDLRNLASPTPQQPQAIDSAAAYDLVFQTINPSGAASSNITNVQRVRYCLDAPATGDAVLWAQTQTWTSASIPAMPSVSGCPADGWTATRPMVRGVTNRRHDRPVFLYNASIKTDITAVTTQLYARAGNEAEARQGLLRTQVFLRNQNQAPTASFTATALGNGNVLLNGSASTDPEGDELRYDWYVDQAPDCRTGTPPAPAAQGIVRELNVGPGSRTISLIVYDSAGLCSRQTRQVEVQ